MRRRDLGLVGLLTVAAILRAVGLSWGIPQYDAALSRGTDLRGSFHPDEDRILWQLERMRPDELDFNPKDFGWGTLETYLLGLALAAANRAGLFPEGWRKAFREARELPRIYLIGRSLSFCFGVLTLLVVYRLAGERRAGLAAAAILAVSPLHVVNSHFLTTDVALGFWMTCSLLFLSRGRPLAGGLLAGLALATKSSALFFLPVLPLGHFVWRDVAWWRVYAAALLGFLLGQPYAVIDFGSFWTALVSLLQHNTVSSVVVEPATQYAQHAFQIAFYGMGPVALGLAMMGLRRRSPRFLAAACGLWFASLGLSRIMFVRYDLPLIPLLSVAAGRALAALPPRRARWWGALALMPPFVFSLGQLHLLTSTHSAQLAADWVQRELPPGTSITQLWYDYPVLDRERYQVRLMEDPFELLGQPYTRLSSDAVIYDNLPLLPFRRELYEDLARHYQPVAHFGRKPRIGPLVLPEPAAAHDWKYTHPEIYIFRRVSPVSRQLGELVDRTGPRTVSGAASPPT